MNISHEKPPCWPEANELFNLEKLNLGTIFTYGDTIYNPSNIPLSQDLLVHEETHAHQQEHNDTVAKLWWQRYIADPEFRLSQEVEAYGRQYAFLCKTYKDRNKGAQMLYRLATALSGPMYGNIVTHSRALTLIKNAPLTMK